MTERIDYRETPAFQRDFKRLAKKYRTLGEDFALVKKATIELFHLMGMNNNAVFPIPAFCGGRVQIFKLKKFACRSLFGKGSQSGLRIIYAFDATVNKVDFIEIYYKGDKENEDRDRIKSFLKEGR
jgi:mRNA-degrading endonuclease RelE of RelBE toxin-antitoxin system